MKTSAWFMTALTSSVLVVITPNVTFAGVPLPEVVPEPASIAIWGGVAVAGGALYWWRNRHQS